MHVTQHIFCNLLDVKYYATTSTKLEEFHRIKFIYTTHFSKCRAKNY